MQFLFWVTFAGALCGCLVACAMHYIFEYWTDREERKVTRNDSESIS